MLTAIHWTFMVCCAMIWLIMSFDLHKEPEWGWSARVLLVLWMRNESPLRLCSTLWVTLIISSVAKVQILILDRTHSTVRWEKSQTSLWPREGGSGPGISVRSSVRDEWSPFVEGRLQTWAGDRILCRPPRDASGGTFWRRMGYTSVSHAYPWTPVLCFLLLQEWGQISPRF